MTTRRDLIKTAGLAAALTAIGAQAQGRFNLGIVGFQMASETHARVRIGNSIA